MRNLYLRSAGGGLVFCRIWEPEGTPRAILQIIHGIAEHSARYDHFARWLNRHGILVAANDHMGHGKSIGEGDVQGYFNGGWRAAVSDVRRLQLLLQSRYPDVPIFLLGHSMGSFMARTLLYACPDSGIRGAIISGTGWLPAPVLKAGQAFCAAEAKRVGETGTSKALDQLMFGGYNKKFAPNRTSCDWLTTVDEEVDRYVADPLCGFPATVGLSWEMLKGIEQIQKKSNLNKMNKQLPVWFFAGDEDPVGDMGKGVLKAVDAFQKAGLEEVYVTLYPGRHEMLNEAVRDEVYDDILDWMDYLI